MTHKNDPIIEVQVPGKHVRMDGAAAAYWDAVGRLFEDAKAKIGRDLAFSVLFSRTLRELRREVGPAGTKEVLKGFIETTDEAASNDR